MTPDRYTRQPFRVIYGGRSRRRRYDTGRLLALALILLSLAVWAAVSWALATYL